MTRQWFTRIGYAEAGPFSTESLRKRLKDGTLCGDTAVRPAETAEWCNLRDHAVFSEPDAAWVRISGQLPAAQFESVPGWDLLGVRDDPTDLIMHFRPTSSAPARITLIIYRAEERGPILTAHDSLQTLNAFLGSVTSMQEFVGEGKAYQRVTIDLVDRIALGLRPGVPWANRALCSLEHASDGPPVQWIVLTAARNHFIKVLVSAAPDETAWQAIFQFLEYLGEVIAPHPGGDTAAPQLALAEQEQWGLCRDILEHYRNEPGEHIFVGPILKDVYELLSTPQANLDATRAMAIRLIKFAQFLGAQRTNGEASDTALCAVKLFRKVAVEGQIGGDLGNLHQALGLLEHLAVDDGVPEEYVNQVRQELAVVGEVLRNGPPEGPQSLN